MLVISLSVELNPLEESLLIGTKLMDGRKRHSMIADAIHLIHVYFNYRDKMGFPIVECSRGGDFILTKPPETGGLVSKATVAEQLVYEIGDPKSYILPDVICDFTNVHIEELTRGESVLVTGATGRQPTDDYKVSHKLYELLESCLVSTKMNCFTCQVSATYADGFKAVAVVGLIGPRAPEKGRKTADAILKRFVSYCSIIEQTSCLCVCVVCCL